MTTLSRFDVAITHFPFIDIAAAKPRPCLVLSLDAFQEEEGAIIAAMITTAARSNWASDLPIQDFASAGLKRPSVIRWKLFTLDLRIVSGKVGALAAADARRAQASLRRVLDL